jgi:hypothetical protein
MNHFAPPRSHGELSTLDLAQSEKQKLHTCICKPHPRDYNISSDTREQGQFSRYSDKLRAGRPSFDSRKGREIFYTAQRLNRLRGPPSLPYNGYRGILPRAKAAGA